MLTTAARPKVKKKDSKVVTTRKVFSKTKLNVDAAKKPRSKLTSAPQTIAKDACEVEDLSHRPERDFQSGKVSQLPDKLPEHISGEGNDIKYQHVLHNQHGDSSRHCVINVVNFIMFSNQLYATPRYSVARLTRLMSHLCLLLIPPHGNT